MPTGRITEYQIAMMYLNGTHGIKKDIEQGKLGE
jgi:hypothetical protein